MQIQNSIKAATHLINSMLPSQDFLKSLFKDLFLIYLSKNIIGGDFYFALKIDQFIFWGVGDAVGHGTEGALLAAQILSQIKYYIALYPYEKPSKILQFLDEFIKRTYTQNHEKKFITVDGIILKYNTATRELIFSSALQSPVIARNKTALIIQTPKAYLGYHLRKTTFTDTKILLEPNDIIYTFTDGIYDQISADNRHKYTKTRFLELIQNICDKPLEQQKQIILNEFYQWKKDFPQTDDVTVFTVKPI
jgi:serine phosphatase RsbU (regulator of sigma subunit)